MLVEYDKDDACIVRHSRAMMKSLGVLTLNYTIPFVLTCRGRRPVAASLKIRTSVNTLLTTESGRYLRIRMLSLDSRRRSTKTMGRREEDEPARSSRVRY
ncbi:hypothetical protein CPC08DRAFT_717493 [Agrocybe pediades]|nr:hypothetical protein CPC08DRAFT_717493 [Agrocybe pediades]